ncbi:SDR family NAD(P)-dependent oxidoreductase [Aliiglaciecola sp. M165]|uniref:SDR family NAD(P)-dependent oxidoreductase n=1 Tax=Aliiglaciecola sp. M165 TaxID=2593649 RepID=UPI00117EC70A|nr:SDR family NAD(P)-dependent oxidoreductase [Aliiglaciecola sp. M165]TRY32828.1 SDR family NAD(P)-dependent oxidoreductase [Aliiglaciecola sp. M165]
MQSSTTHSHALVIGATGGIARQLLEQLIASGRYKKVFGVTRSPDRGDVAGVEYLYADSQSEQSIQAAVQHVLPFGHFGLVICCIGALSGHQNGVELSPEKRLEDITSEQLQSYLLTNTIGPMLWIKHLMPLVKGASKSQIVLFTARVGSISDNKLGGWYGYRASKAALNMLIKTAQVEYQRRAKNVEFVSYHPGTVDTKLSKPFQANVPKEKLFNAEFTAKQLLTHLQTLNIEQSPHYIDWNNQPIQW